MVTAHLAQYWRNRRRWAEYFANRTVDLAVYQRLEAIRLEAERRLAEMGEAA